VKDKLLSCDISSRASNQSARLGLTRSDGERISRCLRLFKSGDFQLMLHLRISRQESLRGGATEKSVRDSVLVMVSWAGSSRRMNSERHSRVGAGEASRSSVL
jgi:hypothetical protein